MRKFIYSFFCIILLLTACKTQEDSFLIINQLDYSIAADGGSIEISIETNSSLQVLIPADADWLEYNTNDNISDILKLTCRTNNKYDSRNTEIVISTVDGNVSRRINVTQEEKKAISEVGENHFVIPAEGGRFQVELGTNMQYSIDINEPWIEQIETRVERETLYFNCNVNNTYLDRSTEITFKFDNGSEKTILVEQKPKIGITEIDKDVFNVSNEGGCFEVQLGTNMEYSLEISTPWIERIQTKFTTETIYFNCGVNESYEDREAAITIKFDNGTQRIIKINQAAKIGVSEVDKDVFVIPANGGDFDVTLGSNMKYTLHIKDEWVRNVQTKMSIETLNFNCDPNETYETRETDIIIRFDNNTERNIKITQDPKVGISEINKDEFIVPYEGGGFSIELGTNMKYNLTFKDEWISQIQSRYNVETLYFICEPHSLYEQRETDVTISFDNGTERVIKIKQDAKNGSSQIDKEEVSVTNESGEFEVVLGTNMKYTIQCADEWISQVETRMTVETLVFAYQANDIYENRETQILIQFDNDTQKIIKVTQSPKVGFASVNKESIDLNAMSTLFDVTLSTNMKFDVIIADNWLNRVNADNVSEIIEFVSDINDTYNNRKTTIRFKFDNQTEIIIPVSQVGKENIGPEITSFKFVASNNIGLKGDVEGTISNDGVSATIPFTISNFNLTPTIDYIGESIYFKVDNQPVYYNRNYPPKINFAKNVSVVIENKEGVIGEFPIKVTANNGIPVLYLKTVNEAPIVSKEIYLDGTAKLDGLGIVPSMDNVIMKIRGRGNSTWNLMPKKPYRIKFDKKQAIAGMPAHKDWVLLANYIDPSLSKNVLGLEISRTLDMDWSSKNISIDVYLNNQYQGNYLLCEQIKIGTDRVNIAELGASDNYEPAVTGGYLLELDVNYDEPQKFYSYTKRLPFMIKDPELNNTQFSWIRNYINNLESIVYSSSYRDPETGYRKHIDTESFIKWWLVYELTSNTEPNWPKSTYMYKDRNGKLKMGPVWDFDWHNVCIENPTGFVIKESIWFDRLFQDPDFVAEVKTIWSQYKSSIHQTVFNIITTNKNKLKASSVYDRALWPDGGSTDRNLTFDSSLNTIESFFRQRLTWLDSAINKL